ncbi:hypothetical protein CBM2589_B100045 [Cupriavidus taiwanensis]|uniref:Uncharacterized protein n=1 Tax=Cupriavidus taiwanensis TaxID=164546 RepID=A0A375BFH9_9BURK|nr:hypothetical protein CBM2589_B100045 [Cupriavidus taiwanensis]
MASARCASSRPRRARCRPRAGWSAPEYPGGRILLPRLFGYNPRLSRPGTGLVAAVASQYMARRMRRIPRCGVRK